MSFTYSVDSETDEAAWHAARAHTEDGQTVVTASEIAMLANGGTSVWANLRAEKAGAKSRWTGNEYTVWGHARESDIAASVTALYPHLAHNTRLVINDEQPWLRGTPDMIGTDNRNALPDQDGTVARREVGQCARPEVLRRSDAGRNARHWRDREPPRRRVLRRAGHGRIRPTLPVRGSAYHRHRTRRRTYRRARRDRRTVPRYGRAGPARHVPRRLRPSRCHGRRRQRPRRTKLGSSSRRRSRNDPAGSTSATSAPSPRARTRPRP